MLVTFTNSKFKTAFYKTVVLKQKGDMNSFAQEKYDKILSESDDSVKYILS